MKICRGCSKSKPLDEYYKHPTSKDGYRNYCKHCCNKRLKESLDPVKRKAYIKNYYKNNANYIKEKSRKWREDNKDRVLEDGKKYSRMRKDKNPELERKRRREYSLKRKYGITLDQYEELLLRQNNSCAICDRDAGEFKTNLAVDHDHKTGRIRGLLCTNCNYRMVAKHRDGELLRKIADYIEQGTDWFVPDKKPKKRKKSARKTKNSSD